jgi:hypothetical protein
MKRALRRLVPTVAALALLIAAGYDSVAADANASPTVHVRFRTGETVVQSLELGQRFFSDLSVVFSRIPEEATGLTFTFRRHKTSQPVDISAPARATVFLLVDSNDNKAETDRCPELLSLLSDRGWVEVGDAQRGTGSAVRHLVVFKKTFGSESRFTLSDGAFSGIIVAAQTLVVDTPPTGSPPESDRAAIVSTEPPAPAADPASMAAALSLDAGYKQVIRDLQNHWWDPTYKIPRIRPTRGGNATASSFDVGTTSTRTSTPSFWQMAQFANVQYWEWKITHSPVMRAEIVSQWNYIRSVFSDAALSSGARSFGIVNVSDDAAWELNYLVQVHEVTNDPRALDDAVALLHNVLERFADPNAAGVEYGSLRASPYGILYATPSDDPGHQGVSTTYEIMLADSALYIYQQIHNHDFLNYAIGTFDWTRKYLKHAKRGYYYCKLNIRPTINGARNRHYLVPVGDYYGPPVRGLSSSYSGTMAMAVAAARLYRITGEQQYPSEAQNIVSAYLRRDAFLRPGNLFVNERDAWTDGHWAPYFADEVLTLLGVDSNGLWQTALRNTALSIISQRTSDGFYSADWSGPELNTNDKTMTWAEQARRGKGSGGGMALPQQIMTSSDAAAMVTAAELVERRAHPQLP